MKDKLRELAEWWRPYSSETEAMADGILDILDAEGDGGAVPDDNLPGMWSNADFTGGDPDERCHAARVSEDEQFNAFRLAYYGANKSLAPELESFRRAYQTITHPERSGVVSDEDVRNALDAFNEVLVQDLKIETALAARLAMRAALQSVRQPASSPCSLSEALNVIENWGRRGNTLQGDDVDRLRALTDKISPPAKPDDGAVSDARGTLVNSLRASKSWMKGYAEAFVDDFASRYARQVPDAGAESKRLKALELALAEFWASHKPYEVEQVVTCIEKRADEIMREALP